MADCVQVQNVLVIVPFKHSSGHLGREIDGICIIAHSQLSAAANGYKLVQLIIVNPCHAHDDNSGKCGWATSARLQT